MNRQPRVVTAALALGCLVAVLCVLAPAAVADDNMVYNGTFTLADNGDMTVDAKFTLPMAQYQRLRDNVSNVYLLLRDLRSSRPDTEVVEQKAEWHDATRSVVFNLKVLGTARNMGNHWEIDVGKGPILANVDEAKRTFFFNVANGGALGPALGVSKVVLPERAHDLKWDKDRRVVTFNMEPMKIITVESSPVWIPGLILIGIGCVALIASFVVKPAAPK